MRRTVQHLGVDRRGPFGGTVYATLCNRINNGGADSNREDDESKVTCKFCLRIIAAKKAKDQA